jgi:hypothetical protein
MRALERFRARSKWRLAQLGRRLHHRVMFVVSDEDAAAIRLAFDQGGEFPAAVELRRRFPAIQDNARARECARTIAGWQPIPAPSKPRGTVTRLPSRS